MKLNCTPLLLCVLAVLRAVACVFGHISAFCLRPYGADTFHVVSRRADVIILVGDIV